MCSPMFIHVQKAIQIQFAHRTLFVNYVVLKGIKYSKSIYRVHKRGAPLTGSVASLVFNKEKQLVSYPQIVYLHGEAQ